MKIKVKINIVKAIKKNSRNELKLKPEKVIKSKKVYNRKPKYKISLEEK